MAEEMETLENWSSRVLPQVISCPKEIVLDALQKTACEFFKETRTWLIEGSDTIQGSTILNTDQCEYTMTLPSGVELVEVESIRLNGIRCSNADFTREGLTIRMNNLPNMIVSASSSFTIYYELWVRPSRYCVDIPRRLLEEYGDCLTYGALASLKLMHGEGDTIKWSDPEVGKMYFEMYKDGINKAKLEAHLRRGFGQMKPCRCNP